MDTVRLVEVGPRDGLQNEAGEVPTAVKVELRISEKDVRTIWGTPRDKML